MRFVRYHGHVDGPSQEHAMITPSLLSTLLLVFNKKPPQHVRPRIVQTLNAMVQLATKGLAPFENDTHICHLRLQMGNNLVLNLGCCLSESGSVDLSAWKANCANFQQTWKLFAHQLAALGVCLRLRWLFVV